jgi:hypothetical protein
MAATLFAGRKRLGDAQSGDQRGKFASVFKHGWIRHLELGRNLLQHHPIRQPTEDLALPRLDHALQGRDNIREAHSLKQLTVGMVFMQSRVLVIPIDDDSVGAPAAF